MWFGTKGCEKSSLISHPFGRCSLFTGGGWQSQVNYLVDVLAYVSWRHVTLWPLCGGFPRRPSPVPRPWHEWSSSAGHSLEFLIGNGVRLFFHHALCREVLKVTLLFSSGKWIFLLDFIMFWYIIKYFTNFVIFVHFWTFLNVSWTFLDVFEHLWTYFETFGSIWHNCARGQAPNWDNLGFFWKILSPTFLFVKLFVVVLNHMLFKKFFWENCSPPQLIPDPLFIRYSRVMLQPRKPASTLANSAMCRPLVIKWAKMH